MGKQLIIILVLGLLSAIGIWYSNTLEHPFFVAFVAAICSFFFMFKLANLITQKRKK